MNFVTGDHPMLGISSKKGNENIKNNHKETSSKKTTPISTKPKILLVDLPKEVSEGLESKGFNVPMDRLGLHIK
jgi:hypothetical protein